MSKIIRSHTRKVVFCYIYMKIFWLWYNNQNSNITKSAGDIFFEEEEDKDFLSNLITIDDIDTTNKFQYTWDNFDEDIEFISDGSHVDIDSLDYDFMNQIINWFDDGYINIKDILTPYLTQFGYGDMDIVKQSLLLLAYLENKHIQTTPAIIINETVELAKSYWSPDVYKIINGVLHNYFNW